MTALDSERQDLLDRLAPRCGPLILARLEADAGIEELRILVASIARAAELEEMGEMPFFDAWKDPLGMEVIRRRP